MPLLLDKRHLPKLASFATSNVLVAFDFDGTLAPIVSKPSQARMRARTRKLLDAVARRYPCVVISGRALNDIEERVEGIPLWHVAGNHGMEPWEQTEAIARVVREWAWQLRKTFAHDRGIVVENKTYSLTIHYRNARSPQRARARIAAVLRNLPGAVTMQGNHAVNVLPEGAPHKGEALERLTRLLGCDAAIYVGDDGTDEPAFSARHPERLLSIRIGNGQRTRARYHLENQREIDRLLELLSKIRPGIQGPEPWSGLRERRDVRLGKSRNRRSSKSVRETGRVRTRSDATNPSSTDRVPRRSVRRSA